MVLMTLWLVRHAEKMDNTTNPNWHENNNPNGLKKDNSPLSSRGLKQAAELAEHFSAIPIDHVFASPFERTMHTANILVAGRNIPIKVEAGLCEVLDGENPGFEDVASLKKRFSLDDTYKPIFEKPMTREGPGDEACMARVRQTIEQIIQRYAGSSSILLVTHSPPIGAIHAVLADDIEKWKCVDQATVSKFVETEEGSGKFEWKYSNDASHLSDKGDKNS